MTRSRVLLIASAVLLFLGSTSAEESRDVHWPSFRGHDASGIARGFSTPVQWDLAKGENLRWKTPVPGLGYSSPVIWGDRVFLTSAISGKKRPKVKVGLYGDIAAVKDSTVHRFMVYCLDKKTGKILWEQMAHEGVPKIQRHPKASHANSTPATDGKHLIVNFGSEGLYVYDLDGKLLWKKDLGVLDAGFFRVPEAQWGYASSPIIQDGKVIVQCDVQGQSFLLALKVTDGEEIWRMDRDEVPTWSSPTFLDAGGRKQIIVNGWHHIGGYDFTTGAELWKMSGGGDIPVPTPVFSQGLIFVTNAHGSSAPIYAIRPEASGDISLDEGTETNAGITWSTARDGAYMQTPLVYDELLYVCRDNGQLSVFVAKTGERLYRQRLGDGSTGFTASSVAADGKLYYTSEMGDVLVVKAGREFEQLAANSLDEISMATPAISEGTLFFRTEGHLVAIGN